MKGDHSIVIYLHTHTHTHTHTKNNNIISHNILIFNRDSAHEYRTGTQTTYRSETKKSKVM